MRQNIFSYLVRKQIWVSLCFISLVSFFQIMLGAVNYPLLIVQFFATISVYNLSVRGSKNDRFSMYVDVILPFVISGLVGLVYLKEVTIICLAVLALFSMQYSYALFWSKFREISGLKIFVIAFVWASSIVFVPLVDSGIGIGGYVHLFISVFLFVLAISIPFDLRDIKTDSSSLGTFPQKYGEARSLDIANVSLVLSVVFFLWAQDDISNLFSVSYLISMLYTSFIFKKSNQFHKDDFVGIWVELSSAIPFLVYIIILFFRQ